MLFECLGGVVYCCGYCVWLGVVWFVLGDWLDGVCVG